MRTHTLFPASIAASLAGALLPLLAGAAPAAPLVLTNVSARVAAARLGARYGMSLVLTQNGGRHVNVSLGDADDAGGAGARLQTVNALANALRLDFTKTITVDRSALNAAMEGSANTEAVSQVEAVDSAASVPFGATRLRTREAIALIAGVDGAFVHIAGDVGGFVTLSKPTLTVGQAEEEIARQTGTTWRAVYTLAPYSGVASDPPPLLVFPDKQWEAKQQREAEEEDRREAQQQATYQGYQQAAYQAYQQALAQRQAAGQASALAGGASAQGMNAQAASRMGYYPNGYGSYGSAYESGGYGNGYGSYGNGYGGSGNGYGSYGNGYGSAGTAFPSYNVGGGM